MGRSSFREVGFETDNPLSIFDYSRFLIGQSLHSLLGDVAVEHKRKGKGGLGQMVEELFFNYVLRMCKRSD